MYTLILQWQKSIMVTGEKEGKKDLYLFYEHVFNVCKFICGLSTLKRLEHFGSFLVTSEMKGWSPFQHLLAAKPLEES